MNRLKKIVEVKERYYPELRTIAINIEMQDCPKGWLSCSSSSKETVYWIYADKQTATLPIYPLQAGIGHELSHIVADLSTHDLKFIHKRMKRYVNEQATDYDVICRGLGSELLAFAEWSLAHRKARKEVPLWTPDQGLHPDEIRTLLASQQRNGILKTLPKHYSTWRARR
jgi:hypothetical protein